MAYWPNCGADNTGNTIATDKLFQFHVHNFDQMISYVESVEGTCGETVEVNFNTPPTVNSGTSAITIPKNTPFVLTGSASDLEGDALTYSWEEFDLYGSATNENDNNPPFFRVFLPVTVPTRTFPQLSDIVNNTETKGERLPNAAQTLKFRLHVYDNHPGAGGVSYAETTVNVDGVSGPFQVTSPNVGSVTWVNGASDTVTWNVAGANAAPVNCANVNIHLSTDGGFTYSIVLSANTPNDGSETITIPNNVQTTLARVRVACASFSDHFFFDISDANFYVGPSLSCAGTNLVVSSVADSGPCTLRDTIANAATGSTITFHPSLSGLTITLLTNLTVNKNLTIDGQDRNITLSGNNAVRLFNIPSSSNATAHLKNLTLTKGYTSSNGGAVFLGAFNTLTLTNIVISNSVSGSRGGAIYAQQSTLTLNNTTIANNSAVAAGGLEFFVGTLTVAHSTFTGNRATGSNGNGGAIELYSSTATFPVTATIYNSTFSGNEANINGGAIGESSSSTGHTTLTITNCTLANNAAQNNGDNLHFKGTLHLINTILASSTAKNDCYQESGSIATNTNNLIKDGSCSPALTGDPKLSTLDNLGGLTKTMALLVDSPALDAGNNTVCGSSPINNLDQRQYARDNGDGLCDIGAFEHSATAPVGANSAPTLTPTTFSIDELSAIGTVVGTVVASDPNPGDVLTYAIIGGNTDNAFAMNSANGQITVKRYQPIDSEINPQFSLAVKVLDNGAPNLADIQTITINVNNVNLAPTVQASTFAVQSNASNGAFVGTVHGEDQDKNDKLTYAIIGGNTNAAFAINASNGDITVANNADFAAMPTYNLTVQATDNGTPSKSATASITVNVVNCASTVVTSAADNNVGCTLRNVIAFVGANETITFDVSLANQTIRLASTITINKNLTIDGGLLKIVLSGDSDNNGVGDVRIFEVSSGSVTLKNLTFEKGSASSNNGGAIYVSSATVALTVANCAFIGNSAGLGGAIYNYGSLTVYNSTFANNTALGAGGGIRNNGGQLTVVNCTFSANSGSPGGIASNVDMTMFNTIIANSVGADCSATVAANLNNLIEDGSCSPAFTGDPNLGPLNDNGGATKTFVLLSPSNAKNNGENGICAANLVNGLDQRGYLRNDGACDIGAFEVDGAINPIVWNGQGTTNNWSEAANWVGNTVPTAAHSVTFNNTNKKPAFVDAGFTAGAVAYLTVEKGYASGVYLSRSLNVNRDLTIESGNIFDLSGNVLTVEGVVSNKGALRTARLVNTVALKVDFLHIKNLADTTYKYYGVEITPTSGSMGVVSVTVWGDQARCVNNANSDGLLRCHDVTPQTPQTAQIRFYFANSERNGQYANALKLWHFNAIAQSWESAGSNLQYSETDWICVSGKGIGCWVQANGISGFSPFVAGSNESPPDAPFFPPTQAMIAGLNAFETDKGKVMVRWQTTSEIGAIGFYLERASSADGAFKRLHHKLLPAMLASPFGGEYSFIDSGLSAGDSVAYRLVEVETNGLMRYHGPYAVTIGKASDFPNLTGIDLKQSASTYSRTQLKTKLVARESAFNRPQSAMRLIVNHTVPSVKLMANQSALYYVSADKIAVPFNSRLDTIQRLIMRNQLELLYRNQPVAYLPAEGNQGIFFYGQAPSDNYASENVYFLKFGKGLTMKKISATPQSEPPKNGTFKETLHLEKDVSPFLTLFRNPDQDYWIWDMIFSGYEELEQKDFAIQIHGAADGQAEISANLYGASNTTHRAVIRLNGIEIGRGTWKGINAYSLKLTVDANLFKEGDNTIQVQGLLDRDSEYSAFIVDSFDIAYPRYYRAVNDTLYFRADANAIVAVEGFTEPTIVLFDVTEPRLPKFITNTTIMSAGNGYQIRFAPTSPTSRYLALTRKKASTLSSIVSDLPSKLKSVQNRADYLVIAPSSLIEGAKILADYRASQGLKTMVVDVADIWDEFSDGVQNPNAIKSFIAYASERWRVKPQYVALIGKGTFDYKNIYGANDNLLPPLMVGTPYGLNHSDNRLVSVKGDDALPDVAVGRIPVVNNEELNAYIQKIIRYETAPIGDWAKRVLFTADNPDKGGAFTLDSDKLASIIPGDYEVDKIYLSETTPQAARQGAIDAINSGRLLVNFIGHAGLVDLADEGFLGLTDMPELQNQERIYLFAGQTCVVGRAIYPGYTTLGEAFVLHRQGGAFAVWGPTFLSMNDDAVKLAEAFYAAIFKKNQRIVGKAILQAYQDYLTQGGLPYEIDNFTLLGDPALRLMTPIQ
jgi:predicted outer membrane repeat protein